jgi:hypothetical protein
MFKKFKNNRNNHAINIDYDEPEDHIAEECPCIEKNKKLREKYLNKYEPTSSNVDQISHNEIPEAPATSNLD